MSRLNNRPLPDLSAMTPVQIKTWLRQDLPAHLDRRDEILALCQADRRKSVRDLADYLIQLEARHDREVQRVRTMYDFDGAYGTLVAGVDEVGRGPLAGPIVGAAVILKTDCATRELILEINDSKKLTARKREELAPLIRQQAVAWAVHEHSHTDIDELGLSFCNNDIFVQSLGKLPLQPEIVLSDGYLIRNYRGRNEKVIKGDARSAAIACASILAKVHRDSLMKEMDEIYPGYGFGGNVGYASKEHIAAILSQGPCPIHRRSFLTRILEETPVQLELDLTWDQAH